MWLDANGDDKLRPLGDNYNHHDHGLWYHDRRSLLDDDSLSIEDDTLSYEVRNASTDGNGNGYLEAREAFDLAMISQGIKADWKDRASLGLDGGKVGACMDQNSYLRGSALYLPSKPHQKPSLWVSIT